MANSTDITALARAIATPRRDGWENTFTGLGDVNRDRRMGAAVRRESFKAPECIELWRASDMAGRIVEALPDDATRKGFRLVTGDEDEQESADAVMARLDELGALKKLRQAWQKARATGGCGIFVGANDGQAADQPLQLEKVKGLDWLTIFDAGEMRVGRYYGDVQSAKFGEPELYEVQPITLPGTSTALQPQQIHESRILRFTGVETDRRALQENDGWADSVFVRVYEVIRDFDGAWDSTGYILQDFTYALMQLDGLAGILAAPDGKQQLEDRIAAIILGRSMLRATVIDKNDVFETKQQPVTGLHELLDKFCVRLAAAADMPVTRLMGQSPAGLNATGEQDGEWWREKVEAAQKDNLLGPLNYLVRLLFKALGKNEPKDWRVEFAPLRQLTSLQEADRRLKVAQADAAYVTAGVVTPEEVAVSRFGGAEYSADTKLVETTVEGRQVKAQEAAEEETARAAEIAAAQPAPTGKPPLP